MTVVCPLGSLKIVYVQVQSLMDRTAVRGGHWGILETAKPKKKSSKTAKPQKNSAKTENRIQNRQKQIQW